MGKWCFSGVTFPKEHDEIVEQVKVMPIKDVIKEVDLASKGIGLEATMHRLGLSFYSGSSGDGWACVDNSGCKHYDYTKQPVRWPVRREDISNHEALINNSYRACLVALRLGVSIEPSQSLDKKNLLQRIVLLATTGDVNQKTEALKALYTHLDFGDLDLTIQILFRSLLYMADSDERDKVFSAYMEIVPNLKEQLAIEKLAATQDTGYIIASFLFEQDKEKKEYWWKALEAKKETHRLKPRAHDNRLGFCLATLVALVECGPVWDGDIPSKSGRDDLVGMAAAVRAMVKGEDGYTAATYLGRELYKYHYGNAASVQEAKANRIAQRTIRKMEQG